MDEDAGDRNPPPDRLEEALDLIKRTFEHAPFSTCVFDGNGRYVWHNAAFMEAFGDGPPPPEFDFLEDPIIRSAGYGPLLEEVRKGNPVRIPEIWYDVKRHDPRFEKSRPSCITGFIFPLKRADGTVFCYFVFHEDVTERERAREEALRAERLAAAGSLAAGIVHDFGNMLTGIVGLARLLSAEPELGEAGRKRVETIREAGEEARDLVRRLKAVSREGGGGTAPVDLHETVRKVCALARHALAKSVRIEASLAAKGSVIEGDGTQLHRPLLNLAINAGQAMPEGGRLTFATADVEGDDGARQLELRVSDTGEGMAPELRDRIFEPFFTTREGEGAGLGLATVREAARRHGGAIRVDSAPGEGTTFTLRFPLTG